MANPIRFKKGLKVNLPILAVAEPAFTTDTKEVFVGNGTDNTQLASTAYVATAVANKTSVTGNAGTATSLTGGLVGTIPYQTGANATAMLPVGTSGQVLGTNGASAPSWKTLDMSFLPDATFKKSVRVATTADLGASLRTTNTLTGYTTTQSLACTTTAASTTVTTTSTAGLKVGAVINAATLGMASGTVVATIASATTFTVTNRANIATTAITGNGTTATATFTVQSYIPYAVGSSIVITGATPSTYNGTFTVTACTTTSVSWASVVVTTATVQGIIAFTISARTTLTTTFTQAITALSMDGITPVLNDRVLVKNQTNVGGIATTANVDNGIYYISTLGTTSVPWVLTRALDADSITEISSAMVAVDSGTLYGGFMFDNDIKTTDVLGTTAMTWNSSADNGKKLNYFAATTSAELASIISDETGTGALVFGTSPTLAGTPLTPTASAGTNTTQIASTAFVNTAIAGKAEIYISTTLPAVGSRVATTLYFRETSVLS